MQGPGSRRSATSEDSAPAAKKQRSSRVATKDTSKPVKERSSQYRGVTKHRRSGQVCCSASPYFLTVPLSRRCIPSCTF